MFLLSRARSEGEGTSREGEGTYTPTNAQKRLGAYHLSAGLTPVASPFSSAVLVSFPRRTRRRCRRIAVAASRASRICLPYFRIEERAQRGKAIEGVAFERAYPPTEGDFHLSGVCPLLPAQKGIVAKRSLSG